MTQFAIVDPSSADAVDGTGSLFPTGEQVQKIRDMLRGRLGDDTYSSWFKSLEFVERRGTVLHVSVPTQFLKKWFQQHFSDVVMQCASRELGAVERLDIALRVPTAPQNRASESAVVARSEPSDGRAGEGSAPTGGLRALPVPNMVRSQASGFEGSPLEA
jgi:chromosomal replication initiator protein